MKKTILIALAGIMLFAFTQCDSGTKEYKDTKALYGSLEKAIKGASNCEELNTAIMDVFLAAFENDYEYAEGEKMTPDEEKKMKEMSDKLDEIYEKKTKDLGCESEW